MKQGDSRAAIPEDKADPKSSSRGRVAVEDSFNQSNRHASIPTYTTKNSRRSSKNLSRVPSKQSRKSSKKVTPR